MTEVEARTLFRELPLEAGLYFVATPIGNARDITLRALDILASADVIAAEDTRTTRHLMDIHGVPLRGRPMVAYHDHNGASARPRLLAAMAAGKSVAYASEAGMPLVADPGYQLGAAAIEAGLAVTCAPGPSAPLAALALSGLPSDRFLFAGFPPASGGARKKWLAGLAGSDATLLIFESPRRIARLVGEMAEGFGPERQAVICRELTKRFEEALRGTLSELSETLETRQLKGEIVLVVDRAGKQEVNEADLEDALREALDEMPVKQAAAEIAARFGARKRDVYQMALALKGSE
ncbi:16S rRNA (cytidine(1402)-2'-O)-methyltransferase [Aliiruegeria sabulilitoris]|uniref:16S rRNA (cytidine(1402)-2'-O)-methyltransferase n=1 Tax=Aliiruegeria sabulilitoris TaxID=1510458 RepID=UPI00082E5792|nr:16S rRNA (cytidine(1402)-2'-O)-methyltransferase [Aliiruegeria sabulilitoris]NDR55927.1 16S rRNA (cytidine(1402)-2'-O)-methyltransferase [Pseudoruegeria sp. M32A2M]